MDVDEFFEHQGVKGMHWGVRKSPETSGSTSLPKRVKPTSELVLTKKFSTGDSVSIYKEPTPFLGRQLAKISPTIKNNMEKGATFSLKDSDGKDVGQAAFYRTSKTELSLDWIHVKPQHRGKGYASAALQGVVKYAQAEGIKKLTLEVPGNAPDARHIYEKLGFKDDPSRKAEFENTDPGENLAWGGLVPMMLNVDSVKHAVDESTAWELQYADEFAQMLSDNFDSEGVILSHSISVDEFLEHQGVKGMHWGIRKDRSSSSSKPKKTSSVRAPREIHQDAAIAKASRAKVKSHGIDALSNEELQKFITRVNLENQYGQLDPRSVAFGKKFATDLVTNTGKSISSEYARAGVKSAIELGIKAATK